MFPVRRFQSPRSRKSVAKSGIPKGVETLLQIGAAVRGRGEQSLVLGFFAANFNISHRGRRGEERGVMATGETGKLY